MMGTILNANSHLAIEFRVLFKKYIPFYVHILPVFIIIGVNFGKSFNCLYLTCSSVEEG